MFRVLGLFGLGAAFLAISPELRATLMDGIETGGKFLSDNSPLSYVGVGIAALAGAMFWVYRAAQPR